jgi:hypothetical protein
MAGRLPLLLAAALLPLALPGRPPVLSGLYGEPGPQVRGASTHCVKARCAWPP